MLSNVIHKHIDGMEAIEAKAKADIDLIFSAIDKKKLMTDPIALMQDVMEEIKKALEEKYIPMAAKEGFDLHKILDKYDAQGKEILIDPSKDPNKNEAIVS